MTVADVYDLITRGGLPVVALLILWAGARRIWVWGYQLEEAQRRADRFEALALKSTHIAATATEAVASTLTKGPGA